MSIHSCRTGSARLWCLREFSRHHHRSLPAAAGEPLLRPRPRDPLPGVRLRRRGPPVLPQRVPFQATQVRGKRAFNVIPTFLVPKPTSGNNNNKKHHENCFPPPPEIEGFYLRRSRQIRERKVLFFLLLLLGGGDNFSSSHVQFSWVCKGKNFVSKGVCKCKNFVSKGA